MLTSALANRVLGVVVMVKGFPFIAWSRWRLLWEREQVHLLPGVQPCRLNAQAQVRIGQVAGVVASGGSSACQRIGFLAQTLRQVVAHAIRAKIVMVGADGVPALRLHLGASEPNIQEFHEERAEADEQPQA